MENVEPVRSSGSNAAMRALHRDGGVILSFSAGFLIATAFSGVTLCFSSIGGKTVR